MVQLENKIGNLLVEVSLAESKAGGKTTSPEFRTAVAKDGFAQLEKVSTLYESFQNRLCGLRA